MMPGGKALFKFNTFIIPLSLQEELYFLHL